MESKKDLKSSKKNWRYNDDQQSHTWMKDPNVWDDSKRATQLHKEQSQLGGVYGQWKYLEEQIAEYNVLQGLIWWLVHFFFFELNKQIEILSEGGSNEDKIEAENLINKVHKEAKEMEIVTLMWVVRGGRGGGNNS